VKATNRDTRRSIRRRKTLVDEPKGKLGTTPLQTALSHVPEVHANEEEPDSEDDARGEAAERRSLESVTGYTSGAPSAMGTDYDEDDAESPYVGGHSQPKHRAFEVVIKEKSKHFLSMIKMDGILTPSPSRRRNRKKAEHQLQHQPFKDSETLSRRTSLSSMRSSPHIEQSLMPSISTSNEGEPRKSMSSSRSANNPDEPISFDFARRPSASSRPGSPPRPQLARRFTILKRTVSGRVVKTEGDLEAEHPEDAVDVTVDTREGVYDSSKKQRVPSWVSWMWCRADDSAIAYCGKRTSYRIPTRKRTLQSCLISRRERFIA
jgi:hypothetical protein